ncbi:MOSC domain-containing protein [Roseibium salinum]|nr:MOSC domain-containing protein [Roseibium salinum]
MPTGRLNSRKKARAFRPGGFGENISSEGFVEEDLCIGDIFSAGSARIQISQGRQPCWKLNMHTDNPGQAAAFQKTGKKPDGISGSWSPARWRQGTKLP